MSAGSIPPSSPKYGCPTPRNALRMKPSPKRPHPPRPRPHRPLAGAEFHRAMGTHASPQSAFLDRRHCWPALARDRGGAGNPPIALTKHWRSLYWTSFVLGLWESAALPPGPLSDGFGRAKPVNPRRVAAPLHHSRALLAWIAASARACCSARSGLCTGLGGRGAAAWLPWRSSRTSTAVPGKMAQIVQPSRCLILTIFPAVRPDRSARAIIGGSAGARSSPRFPASSLLSSGWLDICASPKRGQPAMRQLLFRLAPPREAFPSRNPCRSGRLQLSILVPDAVFRPRCSGTILSIQPISTSPTTPRGRIPRSGFAPHRRRSRHRPLPIKRAGS